MGHSPKALEEFSQASFSLLTSSRGAFGNVLIESMARGCIPIAYDMPFGPADIIIPEINGFLVPSGDLNGLTEAIKRIVAMPEEELTKMRLAAFARAKDFSPEKIYPQWRKLFLSLEDHS
jgi:poly(glycerol-phosphate) alpha-glucosyltransferase